MSAHESPSHWAAGAEDRAQMDADFTEDISVRMRIPKRIKANGDVGDEDLHGPNGLSAPWAYKDNFTMNVPDRIMLLGQDQHIGTRAPPREIVLENSVLGANTVNHIDVRVHTPPRVITLAQHMFPSASEPPLSPELRFNDPLPPPPPLVIHQTPVRNRDLTLNDTRLTIRDGTPPMDGLTASEEVLHLRRQVARINRRVMAVELDALQRQQRERLAAALGLAYLLIKVIAWLNRS